jgi:hypothetical protein
MTNLKKELDTLKRNFSQDNDNRRKVLAQVSEGLLNMHNEAVAFVSTRKE